MGRRGPPLLLLMLACGCVTPTQRAVMRFGAGTTAAVAQLRLALHSPVAACHQQSVPRMTLVYADSSKREPQDCADIAAAAVLQAATLEGIDGLGEAMSALSSVDEPQTESLSAAATTAGDTATKLGAGSVVGSAAAGIAGALGKVVSAIGNQAATFQLVAVIKDAREPMRTLLAQLLAYFAAADELLKNTEAAIHSVKTEARAGIGKMSASEAASLAAVLEEMDARLQWHQHTVAAARAVVTKLTSAWDELAHENRALGERKEFVSAVGELADCVFRRCRSLIPTHADHRFRSMVITPERDDAGMFCFA